MILEKRLDIDNDYIRDIFENHLNDWRSKVDEDLKPIIQGSGEVHLKRPYDKKLNLLFVEMRSYIAARSITGDYKIFAQNLHDDAIIKSVIGNNNALGNYKSGIYFNRAA